MPTTLEILQVFFVDKSLSSEVCKSSSAALLQFRTHCSSLRTVPFGIPCCWLREIFPNFHCCATTKLPVAHLMRDLLFSSSPFEYKRKSHYIPFRIQFAIFNFQHGRKVEIFISFGFARKPASNLRHSWNLWFMHNVSRVTRVPETVQWNDQRPWLWSIQSAKYCRKALNYYIKLQINQFDVDVRRVCWVCSCCRRCFAGCSKSV